MVFRLAAIVSVPLAVFAIASASGQANPEPAGNNSGPTIQPTDHEQIVSYWTAEGGWNSELQLRNNLSDQVLVVTPVLRSADGEEAPLPAVTIRPQEVRAVDIGASINASAPQMLSRYGSLALRYHSLSYRNLYAALMVHDTGRPIAFHIDALGKEDYEIASREGIWWLPNEGAKDILILTNQGDETLDISLSLYDAEGHEVVRNTSLGARQTARYSVRQIVQQGGLSGSFGGIRVYAPAHAGSLDTLHALYDESAGFSALLKMFDHNPDALIGQRDYAKTSRWTLRAPMLALTNPDPALNFPSGTVLKPQLFVRNTTSKTASAALSFHWRSGTATGKTPGPTLTLKPFETRRVDVSALQSAGGIPLNATWASVYIETDTKPDEIMAVAASYDTTLRYGAQTPFSDQLSHRWEGGLWQVDSMHDSIITAGNGGLKSTNARFTIYYNQGRDRYDSRTGVKAGRANVDRCCQADHGARTGQDRENSSC